MPYCRQIRARHASLDNGELAGAPGFLSDVAWLIARAHELGTDSRWIILAAATCFAYIRLGDIGRPWRFLGNMAGKPPIQYGPTGFRAEVVDDENPARHYTAFVFMGYFLPKFVANLVLWAWEMLGYVRYGGQWSWPDIRSGQIGIRHGSLLRHYSAVIWPALIARDLMEPQPPVG